MGLNEIVKGVLSVSSATFVGLSAIYGWNNIEKQRSDYIKNNTHRYVYTKQIIYNKENGNKTFVLNRKLVDKNNKEVDASKQRSVIIFASNNNKNIVLDTSELYQTNAYGLINPSVFGTRNIVADRKEFDIDRVTAVGFINPIGRPDYDNLNILKSFENTKF